MPQAVPRLSTAVSYWYGSREKKKRARDIAYVKKIFPYTQFRELPGMEHGEYSLMHQKEFAGDVVRFVYNGSDNPLRER
jgi:hypothetical protein